MPEEYEISRHGIPGVPDPDLRRCQRCGRSAHYFKRVHPPVPLPNMEQVEQVFVHCESAKCVRIGPYDTQDQARDAWNIDWLATSVANRVPPPVERPDPGEEQKAKMRERMEAHRKVAQKAAEAYETITELKSVLLVTGGHEAVRVLDSEVAGPIRRLAQNALDFVEKYEQSLGE